LIFHIELLVYEAPILFISTAEDLSFFAQLYRVDLSDNQLGTCLGDRLAISPREIPIGKSSKVNGDHF